MTDKTITNLETHLAAFTESEWLRAIEILLPEIHAVDRNAVQIWFRFFPLELMRAIASSEDREKTIREFALQGKFELKDQIDSSHHFLYGHRFWKKVKCVIENEAETGSGSDQPIADVVRHLGITAAEKLKVERPLVNGIVLVGLMTLNQVGLEAFRAAAGETEKPTGIMSKSPDAIIAERANDDSQGLFGFLKTVDKKFTVTYDNIRHTGKFPIMNDQEVATASSKNQTGTWKEADDRCWEGVVPVECLSASCGTCWVGVLSGQEKLTEVSRRERRSMKVFGYNQPDEPTPFLRLACQAKASGNISIVIPPWNGVFGKKIYGNVEDLELEPATTSARALRDTIASAATGE